MALCQEQKILQLFLWGHIQTWFIPGGWQFCPHFLTESKILKAICISVCQEQNWVLGRLFLTSSKETSRFCCQQIIAWGPGTLSGPHRRKCTKATEAKYLVFSNSHTKLRLFKRNVGLGCISSSIWKIQNCSKPTIAEYSVWYAKELIIIHD